MNGQLWEPCPRCGAEPVCVNCGYCERHCRCGRPQPPRPGPAAPYQRGCGQGFGPGEDGVEGGDEC